MLTESWGNSGQYGEPRLTEGALELDEDPMDYSREGRLLEKLNVVNRERRGRVIEWLPCIPVQITEMCRTIALIAVVCAWMIEVSAQVTWQRAYGGQGISEGHGIRETVDHGFIVVGSTGSFGSGASDIYVLKLDNMGALQWSKTLGGPSIDQGWAIRPLVDGGYVLAGYTDAGTGRGFDGVVMRLDGTGEPLWEQAFGTEGWDFLYDVEVLPDGFVAVGGTYRAGEAGEQAWVVRLDAEGTLLWERMLGDEDATEARSVRRVAGDSLVIAGSWGLPDGSRDAFLAKFDPDGNQLWSTLLTEAGDNAGYSVVELSDGSYALGGFSTLVAGRSMLLAKVAMTGGLQWINHIDGGTGVWEGRAVREDYGGGLVLAGMTTSYGNGAEDLYMARTDAQGYWVSGPSFGTAATEQCWDMDLVADGGYVLVGTTQGAEMNFSSVYVVKNAGGIIGDPLIEVSDPLAVPGIDAVEPWTVSPNPVVPGDCLRIGPSREFLRGWYAEVIDMRGSVVAKSSGQGQPTAHMAVPQLRGGTYVLRLLLADGGIRSMRLMVEPE